MTLYLSWRSKTKYFTYSSVWLWFLKPNNLLSFESADESDCSVGLLVFTNQGTLWWACMVETDWRFHEARSRPVGSYFMFCCSDLRSVLHHITEKRCHWCDFWLKNTVDQYGLTDKTKLEMLKEKKNPPVINIVVNSPLLAFSLWVFPIRKARNIKILR